MTQTPELESAKRRAKADWKRIVELHKQNAELVEALKEIIHGYDMGIGVTLVKSTLEKARTAIAKAEGRIDRQLQDLKAKIKEEDKELPWSK